MVCLLKGVAVTKRTITTGLLTVVFLGLSTAAQEQDWYHDRDGRYRGSVAVSRVLRDKDRFGPYLER